MLYNFRFLFLEFFFLLVCCCIEVVYTVIIIIKDFPCFSFKIIKCFYFFLLNLLLAVRFFYIPAGIDVHRFIKLNGNFLTYTGNKVVVVGKIKDRQAKLNKKKPELI